MSDDDVQNDDGSTPEEAPAAEAPAESSGDFLEDTFGITKAGSTMESELMAGLTTSRYILSLQKILPNTLTNNFFVASFADTGVSDLHSEFIMLLTMYNGSCATTIFLRNITTSFHVLDSSFGVHSGCRDLVRYGLS